MPDARILFRPLASLGFGLLVASGGGCAGDDQSPANATGSGGNAGGNAGTNAGGGAGIPTSPDDAVFVEQDVPTAVEAGASFVGTFTFRNSGTEDWSESATSPVRLGFPDLTGDTEFGTPPRMVLQPGEIVRTGESTTFTETFVAPSTPGTYTMRWQMVRELVHWFGEVSDDVAIEVKAPEVTGRETLGRGVVALPRDSGVYVSWRLLPQDAPGATYGTPFTEARFNVYRSTSIGGPTRPWAAAPSTQRTTSTQAPAVAPLTTTR